MTLVKLESNMYLSTIEPPFDKYSGAYTYISKRDGRRNIKLYGPGLKSFTTTYARYIFQIDYWKKHKELIPDGYEVDHVNENKLDDRVENLQLLTVYENRQKNNFSNGSKQYVIICPVCGLLFTAEPYNLHPESMYTCSNQCDISVRVSHIPDHIRKFVSNKQIKRIVKLFRSFPTGENSHYELITEFEDTFYPNSFKNYKEWLPNIFHSDMNFVDVKERDFLVGHHYKNGLSERSVAKLLNISREAVRSSLKRLDILN